MSKWPGCPTVSCKNDLCDKQCQRHLDDAARALAEWFGYAWEGLREGRITDRGYKPWAFDGAGHKIFQGRKQDVRDMVEKIVAIARGYYEQDGAAMRGDGK